MNIYGASGHGKVIIDIMKSGTSGEKIHYIFDDNPAIQKLAGYQVQHTISEEMLRFSTILGIGDNATRRTISKNFRGQFSKAVIHNAAVISASAEVKEGTVIMANAVVNADAVVGRHCIINTGAIIEHDVFLGDFVHISPNAVLAGNVEVDEGSQIGVGAIVIPGIKIGKWVTVGAGAVIINDVPDAAVVVGNPGKIIKFNHLNE